MNRSQILKMLFSQGKWHELIGLPPFAMFNSLKAKLKNYKIYGNSVQNGTPTNTTPVDIDNVGDKIILPNGYKKLDYIQGTGTQYINTGTTSKYSNRFVVDAKIDELNRYNQLIGNYSSVYGNPCYCIYIGSSNKYSYYWGKTYGLSDITADTSRHLYYIDKNVYRLDGNNIILTDGSERTGTNTNYLFWAGTSGRVFIGKIYSAQIYEDDTLVRNFVPCKNASNVVGMYDTVTKTFYVNSGTGDFIAGNEITDYYKIPVTTHSRNMINYKYATTQTINDVTFTNNGDGTFTVNGTASASAQFYLVRSRIGNTIPVIAGHKYLFKGSPVGASSSSYRMSGAITGTASTQYPTDNSGVGSVTTISQGNNTVTTLYIYVPSGTVCNNLVFKPEFIDLTELYGAGNEPSASEYNDSFEAYKSKDTIISLEEPLRGLYRLPIEYQELDYIQSTGEQYINTGIIPNDYSGNWSFEFDFQLLELPSANAYACGTGSSAGRSGNFQIASSGRLTCYIGTSSAVAIASVPAATAELTSRNTYKCILQNNDDSEVQKNETRVGYTGNTSTTTSSRAFYLFSMTETATLKMKVYSFKARDNNNNLVRNMIPCYRKSDKRAGLYDIINNNFYSYTGTTDFIKGNNANTYVDYIDYASQKIYRNVTKLVLTGNEEDWATLGSGTSRMFRLKISDNQIVPLSVDTLQLCNYAECKTVIIEGTEVGASVYFSGSLKKTYFRIRLEDTSISLNTFKATLQEYYTNGKPFTIIYPAYTTTEENTELIQLDTLKPTTIIDVNTEIPSTNVYIKYKGK